MKKNSIDSFDSLPTSEYILLISDLLNKLDTRILSSSDLNALVDDILNNPILAPNIRKRLKALYNTPNRYFMESLRSLESDWDPTTLLRIIHQQDESIAYLSHQLVSYDSFIKKYDKLAVKVDFLKRQNHRLLSNVRKSKNNR